MAAEQAQPVSLVHDPHRLVSVPEQEGVRGLHPAVTGIWIPQPPEVAGPAAVGAFAPATVGCGLEGLRGPVGDEHRDASRTAVGERGVHRVAQVSLGQQVVHGVMHEHGVTAAVQAHCPHVAQLVVAVRVQPP